MPCFYIMAVNCPMNKRCYLSDRYISIRRPVSSHYCSVFSADVSPLASPALFSMYYSMMPPHRQEKIDRLRIEQGKRLSLGAGILLRLVLISRGVDLSRVRVETDAHGKPFLPDYPRLHFNLSHSGSRVLCVISDLPCGCDVEEIGRGSEDLVTRFFSPEEQSYCLSDNNKQYIAMEDVGKTGGIIGINSTDIIENRSGAKHNKAELPDDFQYRFTRVWTRKESYLKATGEGFFRSPESFSVFSLPSSVHYYEYNTFPGYHVSVCLLFPDSSRNPG